MATLGQSTSEGIELVNERVEVETVEYSLNDALEHIGFGRYQIKVILIAGLSWMADAMEMMVLSILSPVLMCEWQLSSSQEAMITTVVFLGMGIGSAAWGYLGDVYGRKRSLLVSAVLVLYFGALSSLSPSYSWILFLRFVVGFGIGGVPQAVVIVTEVMPLNTRGRAVVSLQFFWAIGSIFAAAIAIGAMRELNWHWYLLFITIPMLLFLISAYWLPKSPRYMLTTGDYENVKKLLQSIANENGKTLPGGTLIAGELNDSRGNLMEMFQKRWLKTSCLLFVIWFTSVFCYYGIVLLTTEMFQTGINGCHPHIKNGTISLEQCRELTNKDYIDFMVTTFAELPGMIVAIILIELIGRRKSLALQFGLASVAYLLLLICTGRSGAVIFIFAARALIEGCFQTAYVYTPEVLPTNIRSVGMGLCSMFGRFGAILTPFVAQVMIRQSFSLVIGVYVAPLLVCMVASLLLKVETTGKILQDSAKDDDARHQSGYQSFD